MKQKYVVIKDDDKNMLRLQEYAELDKDSLSLLCEETYSADSVRTALQTDRSALLNLLRTKNLYPPIYYTAQLVHTVAALYENETEEPQEPVELLFDDADLLSREPSELEEMADIEEDTSDLDDLLDDGDDIDDDFDDDDTIGNIGSNSSLKIADDESLDVDDDA